MDINKEDSILNSQNQSLHSNSLLSEDSLFETKLPVPDDIPTAINPLDIVDISEFSALDLIQGFEEVNLLGEANNFLSDTQFDDEIVVGRLNFLTCVG